MPSITELDEYRKDMIRRLHFDEYWYKLRIEGQTFTTFREQIQDQIAYHKSKISDLEGVLDLMTPKVEKFVEAIRKLN